MKTRILPILFLLPVISCGGGGGSTGDEAGNPVNPNHGKGIFIDSPVSGLNYTCTSLTGITSDQGEFECDINSSVTFSVGGVLLGSTHFATILSPVDLVVGGSGTRNTTVQNIARFLQMLDYDGDPSNGIEISPEVRNIAAGWQQIDFSQELNISDYISDAASVDNTPHNLPDGDTASTHLEQSLGIDINTTPRCSNTYPDTVFCDDAAFPTCDSSSVTLSSIVSGMNYNDVVDKMGCHGVLTNATTTSISAIATYAWGTRTGYDWVITFIEQNGRAVVHSATKY